MTSFKGLAGSGAAARALTLAAMLCVGLSGCSIIRAANILNRDNNKAVASQGERIPVLPEDDQITPSAALKGQDFSLPAPTTIASWPVPGGTPEQSIEHAAAAPDLRIAWRQNLGIAGENRKHFVTAPPIMADGRVYAMDGQATVSAHDARFGRRLWSVDVRPKGREDRRDRDAYGGGLAYANGRVFVTSGYRLITALDAKTGKTIWTTRTDAPLHSAPNVAAGLVYAVTIDDQLLAVHCEHHARGHHRRRGDEVLAIEAGNAQGPPPRNLQVRRGVHVFDRLFGISARQRPFSQGLGRGNREVQALEGG